MPARKVILMYHSVSSPDVPGVRGSFPIPLDRFVHQMEQARHNGWTFGRVSQLRDPVAQDTLYITGDDGTIDWARSVLPWCEERGIPTHTAIITGPWLDPPIYPIAHRVQVLLTLGGRELPMPALTAEQRAYVDGVYGYETDPRRRYLKGACNVILNDAEAQQLLGEPDSEELEHLRERFAAPSDYRGCDYAEFGVHTVSHRAFDGNVEGYLHTEILPCCNTMKSWRLEPTRCFTLPMAPRHPARAEQLVDSLKQHGFTAMFHEPGEWDGESFIVPRIDARNVESALGFAAWRQEAAA